MHVLNNGPQNGKVLLETDFPVIEEKPIIHNMKTLITSEEKKLDLLHNKGNLKLLNLQQQHVFYPFIVLTVFYLLFEEPKRPAKTFSPLIF